MNVPMALTHAWITLESHRAQTPLAVSGVNASGDTSSPLTASHAGVSYFETLGLSRTTTYNCTPVSIIESTYIVLGGCKYKTFIQKNKFEICQKI